MSIEKGGRHPDPEQLAPPSRAEVPELVRAAVDSSALKMFGDGLRLPGGSIRDGVIDDLSSYYRVPAEEVAERCMNWESWSVAEWLGAPRESVSDIAEFYRTTVSWSFDLLWFAYLQAELHRYPVSAVVATSLLEELPEGSRHLDFGCGVGATSQLFHRLGYQSDMADIATGMLAFAKYRVERRGDDIKALDLNESSLVAGRYDVVTAIDTLVHIPDLERVLGLLHRSIRTGGYLFANVAARPRTLENAQFLYDDELPVRLLIQRTGFEPVRRLDGMVTQYMRVETSGWRHRARGARDRVLLSPVRPIARDIRDRVASAIAGS